MSRKPSIPAGDAEFDEYTGKYCHIVNQKTSGENPEWTHIPVSSFVPEGSGGWW
jgi:hypothetical protein